MTYDWALNLPRHEFNPLKKLSLLLEVDSLQNCDSLGTFIDKVNERVEESKRLAHKLKMTLGG